MVFNTVPWQKLDKNRLFNVRRGACQLIIQPDTNVKVGINDEGISIGVILNLKDVPEVGKYLLIFHNYGLLREKEGDFDKTLLWELSGVMTWQDGTPIVLENYAKFYNQQF